MAILRMYETGSEGLVIAGLDLDAEYAVLRMRNNEIGFARQVLFVVPKKFDVAVLCLRENAIYTRPKPRAGMDDREFVIQRSQRLE